MRNETNTIQLEEIGTDFAARAAGACRVVAWKRTDNPDIVAIQQYIDAHYMRKITLEGLSRQFFISSSYLCELFRKTTGTTLISYVMMTRMQRAVQLMRTSSASLYSIAEQVGYVNYGYFARLFKQFHGISPEQYRNGMSPQERYLRQA